jgi:hypothetical protein
MLIADDAMATPQNACNCDSVLLLRKAVYLIDPPRYADAVAVDDTTDQCDNGSKEAILSLENALRSSDPENDHSTTLNEAPVECSTSKKTKRVHFKESSCHRRKQISVHDVIQAYDFLIHALSILSSDHNKIQKEDYDSLLRISWESLQQYSDTYRALLITSNLLLEMLPSEHTALNPTSIQGLLSTSRRCILLLQSLEKLCAAKTIAERHICKSTMFYTGGDDIEDYDRSVDDLHMNYDWHDDGFLPKPGSFNCKKAMDQNDFMETSIIHECCCRPVYSQEQPSSRYEKSASTKELVRGERLISMSPEDYDYFEGYSNFIHELKNPVFNQDNTIDQDESDNTSPVENYNDCGLVMTIQPSVGDETDIHGNTDSNAQESFLALSTEILAQEEEKLLKIMISSDQSNVKSTPRRKKKKKKTQLAQTGEAFDLTDKTPSLRKEGFLLLVCNNEAVLSIKRVYAKLHPSGWLSIEERSNIMVEGNKRESSDQSLSHRTRYWDYFICQSTTCQPHTRDGVMTFHFCVDNIRILGASSLKSRYGADNASSTDSQANHNSKKTNLLFAVDEGTGGTLADGFEWVCTLLEVINTSKTLYAKLTSL